MSTAYLYPRWVRLWHLINALLYLVLIVTGLTLQYSNKNMMIIRFDIAVTIHNVAGILLTANYLLILIGNRFTGNGVHYHINWRTIFSGVRKQFHYYTIGLFKGEKAPYPITVEQKFNPMQKFSYVIVIYFLMPLIFITGWALIFPELIFFDVIFGTSGIHFTDLIHIIVGFSLSMFMFIHVYFCSIGKPFGTNYKAIITGWHHSEE